MEPAVFINYRGEDSHSYGALLYTELARRFGDDSVFLDSESIPAGADFVAELVGRVRSARVLLAVIGPRWLTATGADGGRRLDDPADWIHRELTEAFAAGVRVIPVLTEDSDMPGPSDLPPDIAVLSQCQFRRLRYREPRADLARIVTDLTTLDPHLAAIAHDRDRVPRQLPVAPGLFIGRATELAALTTVATPDAGATVVISAIGGAGGIGKTALALHWAYQHLHRFPDGQLYVNLRGFDPSGHPTPTGEAVRGFLDALGVDPATLPVELDAQAARYRSLVAGRQMLIVLDNAYDIDQVTPLLPGSPSCTVLITSRHHLAGLAALHSARLLNLDVLPDLDAHDLLARLLGPDRLAAEPPAVADLLAICAGLPLALRIVATRAQRHPDFPLAVLADELRDASARLDGLDAGDLRVSLRAVLSWSLRALSTPAAAAFGLLGVVPGPDIGLPAAEALLAMSTGPARTVLRELEDASLVQQLVPDRFRMHDLIRLYATDIARHQLAPDVPEAALRRVTDFYLHTAQAADRRLNPDRQPIALDPPADGVHPHPLPDDPAALAWLDAEHAALLAVQPAAAGYGWYDKVWQLAWTLETFHHRRGHRYNRLFVWQAALAAAEQLPDPAPRTTAHRALGNAHWVLGNDEDGVRHMLQALALAEEHQDPDQQARVHWTLAWARAKQGDDRRALEHATRAHDLFRTLGQTVGVADALNAMGWYNARLGEYDKALTNCRAALVLLREHHDPEGEAGTLDSLGYIAHQTGENEEAISNYEQALDLLRAHDNMSQYADTLGNMGNPYVALGRHDRARAVWREALALYQQQGRDADAIRIQRELDSLDRTE